MPQGALTVQSDGTFRVESHPDEDTAALEATLSGFADLVCPTAEPRVYCLTAASIWRARRAGLGLEEMLQVRNTKQPEGLLDPLSHADNEPALSVEYLYTPHDGDIKASVIAVGVDTT